MPIQLSLVALLRLIEGDDDLAEDRKWIRDNTVAITECTVIRADLALEILAEDPSGAKIHIQQYKTPDGRVIYTLWTPVTWTTSAEKHRLFQREHGEWRRTVNARIACETIAAEHARYLTRTYGLDQTTLEGKFCVWAEQLKFSAQELLKILNEYYTRLGIEPPQTQERTNETITRVESSPSGETQIDSAARTDEGTVAGQNTKS